MKPEPKYFEKRIPDKSELINFPIVTVLTDSNHKNLTTPGL